MILYPSRLTINKNPLKKRAKQQKEDFNNNTLRIVKNIQIAAGLTPEEDLPLYIPIESLYEKNLLEQFYRVKKIIAVLAQQNINLYDVMGFEKSEIEAQVSFGFLNMLKPLGYDFEFKTKGNNITVPDNLSAFCDKFLSNPEAILHHDTSHQFYDRVHLLAALEQSKKGQIQKR